MRKIKAQNGTPSPYMVKRAAQEKVKQANIRARDSVLNRNAAAKGMTREEVQKEQARNKNKPDQPIEGLYTDKDRYNQMKHCESTHECKEGNKQRRQEYKEGFKNGGKITSKKNIVMKKAQTGYKLPITKKSTSTQKKVSDLIASKKSQVAQHGGKVTKK